MGLWAPAAAFELLFILETQNDPIISELGVFVWPLFMSLVFFIGNLSY